MIIRVKDILILCSDGLTGIKEAIQAAFPTDESLMKCLYLATKNITKKWTTRYGSWDLILAELSIMFDNRI